MNYDQFENQLQDLLDEGRLDEADRMLGSVCAGDRPRCAQLLATYRALFSGLPNALHPVELNLPASPAIVSTERGEANSPLSFAAMALALCLTVLVAFPGQWRDRSANVPAPKPAGLVTAAPQEASDSEFANQGNLNPQERHFARLATSSFEPLARDVATRTGSAFKSMERFADTLNPVDEHLAAYREAAPLISTLARGFMPGTHSLGDAFSVLQESAATEGNNSPAEPEALADAPLSTQV